MREFQGSNLELHLLRLLLKSAMVLEKVNVITHCAPTRHEWKKISQELLTYPRASSKTSTWLTTAKVCKWVGSEVTIAIFRILLVSAG
ncbi:hypothetical protein ACLOJK_020354 [Asimina triloba]